MNNRASHNLFLFFVTSSYPNPHMATAGHVGELALPEPATAFFLLKGLMFFF